MARPVVRLGGLLPLWSGTAQRVVARTRRPWVTLTTVVSFQWTVPVAERHGPEGSPYTAALGDAYDISPALGTRLVDSAH